jgi:cytochrome c oxidase assembly protein subunit 15
MKEVISRSDARTIEKLPEKGVHSSVRRWLFIGLVLVFFQVVIGGITRLTDSGLSITEWELIQGVIPPLNEAQWVEAFEKYQEAAKKQFESLHADMTLGEFKVIYFWEYFHRLWARMMGFVFIVPLLFFLWKKWIPGWLGRRLTVVFLLAAAAAVFGWIMVKSGLNNDNRTWVSAYKLIIHLGIATSLFGYLFWTYLKVRQPVSMDGHLSKMRKFANGLIGLLIIQILLGGLMAGMRAGLVHPHFPFFVEAGGFYQSLFQPSLSGMEDFMNYEPSAYIKSWIQVFHRATAYILVIFTVYFFIRLGKQQISSSLNKARMILVILLFLQFILGVLTVVYSIGKIPVFYGVLHQGMALLLFAALLGVRYQLVAKNTV